MRRLVAHPAPAGVRGEAPVPGDKSIGHRAALLGALASGEVVVTGMGGGEDNRRALAAAAALGAEITPAGDGVSIRGVGLDGLCAPADPIDCGNAGTAMRLLAGILAGLPEPTALTGDASLCRRPMRRIADPLERMGARVRGREGDRPGEIYPPLEVRGPLGGRLRGIEWNLDVASAQVKSAILLAGLAAGGPSRVREPGPSRDHTERMLAYMGAPIRAEGREVVLDPGGWARRLEPRPLTVPGDPSAAAFLAAAALVAPGGDVIVRDVCTNPTRTGFFDALAAMGAPVDMENPRAAGGEEVADLRTRPAPEGALRGAEIGGDVVVRAIDEIPVLAVVAARAEGETRFRDAAELRVKESDRIATTAAMLRALGVGVEEHSDGLVVAGQGARPLEPGRVDAAGDHRIAMAAAVAALAARGPVAIDDAENVATSFPEFPRALAALGARIDSED